MSKQQDAIDCANTNFLKGVAEEDWIFYKSRIKSSLNTRKMVGEPRDSSHLFTGNKKKQEQRRYVWHKRLYDSIYSTLVELGSLDGFRSTDPIIEYLDMLGDAYQKQFNEPIVDFNSMGPSRVVSMSVWYHRTLKQGRVGITGRHHNPNAPLTAWERMLIEPSRLVLSRDKEGYVYNLVNKLKSFSDLVQGKSSSYKRKIIGIQTKLQSAVQDNFTYDQLNDYLFEGLGDHSKYIFTTDSKPIRIVGIDNESYHVRFIETDELNRVSESDVQVIPRTRVDFGEGDISEFVSQSFHKFYKGVLAGRVRYIVPKHIPSDPKEFAKFRGSPAGKFITSILEDVKKQQEINEAEDETLVHDKIHRVTDQSGDVFHYIMYKEEEGGANEKYSAYIVKVVSPDGTSTSFVKTGKVGTETAFSGEEGTRALEDIIPEGWYKAQGWDLFQRRRLLGRKKDKSPIYSDMGNYRAYHRFNERVRVPRELESHLWDAVQERRGINKDFWRESNKWIKRIRGRLEAMSRRLEKKMTNEGYTDEEIGALLDEAMSVGGYRTNVYRDPNTGVIKTTLDFIEPKASNYDPNQFYEGDYEDEAGQRLDDAKEVIGIIEEELEEDDYDSAETRDAVEADLAEWKAVEFGIERTLRRIAGAPISSMESPEDIDIINKPVHFKHIGTMMDHTKRREDAQVDNNYFDRTITALQMNEIKVQLLQSLLYTTDNKTLSDYLIRMTKVAFGESNYKSDVIDNEGMANFLNKIIPKAIREGRLGENKDYTPDDVQFYTTFNNLIYTSKFLNWWSALQNNFQRLNVFVHFGWEISKESFKLNDPKHPQYKKFREAVEETGVLELLSAFNEMLMGMHSADPTFRDLAMVRRKEALAFLNLSRRKFIDGKGMKNIDYAIRRASGLGVGQQDLVRFKRLKGLYWDIVSPNSTMDKALVEDRLKKIMRGISKSQLRRAAFFTLKWFPPPIKAGQGYLTFSGVEENLRAETAIAAMLVADRMGYLPKGEGRFTSPEAISIGRNAVYNLQFGMSPQFHTTAFGGPMKGVMQFKGYTYFQHLHDKKIVENMINSTRGQSLGDISHRAMDALQRLGQKGKRRHKGDIELAKMARFASTRVIASGLGVFVQFFKSPAYQAAKFLKQVSNVGMLTGRPLGTMFRGGESPVLGLIFRAMYYFTLFGIYADEDDDDSFMRDMRRLFFPPFISYWIEMFITAKDEKLWWQQYIDPPY